jgi:hypothetical protein
MCTDLVMKISESFTQDSRHIITTLMENCYKVNAIFLLGAVQNSILINIVK